MAKKDATAYFRKMRLQFTGHPDPLYSMLQWLTERMMQREAESLAGAPKGKKASWQRCRIHFMRNILAHVGQREKAMCRQAAADLALAGEKLGHEVGTAFHRGVPGAMPRSHRNFAARSGRQPAVFCLP